VEVRRALEAAVQSPVRSPRRQDADNARLGRAEVGRHRSGMVQRAYLTRFNTAFVCAERSPVLKKPEGPILFVARLMRANEDESAADTGVFGGELEDIMRTRYTVALSMIAGAALGGAAIQGLHAQAKPKAYQITELEIIDNAAWQEFVKAVRATQQSAGGRNLRTAGGKVVAFVGDPPKHVGLTEFDSLDQAVAYRNSPAFKELDPLRNKAIKIVRQFTVEAEN
jgi:uncharacterized protein (DUF1330 family)